MQLQDIFISIAHLFLELCTRTKVILGMMSNTQSHPKNGLIASLKLHQNYKVFALPHLILKLLLIMRRTGLLCSLTHLILMCLKNYIGSLLKRMTTNGCPIV